MRSLLRLIMTLLVLAGMVYGSAVALVLFVEPKQEQEEVIKVPDHKINTQ